MVKVTGRTRDAGHLYAHFEYIARNGQLELEGSAGEIMVGRQALADLADTWAACDQFDSRRRTNSPVSLSVVLSMPAGTDAAALYDAARAFAADTLAGRHDYVFTLHTDTPRPHVHLSIHARGHAGERLNPKKADLDAWRRAFAQALRDRGVEAEATPRRARGVTRKAERGPIRRLRERQAKAGTDPGRVRLSVLRDAAQAAFQGDTALRPWELNLVRRQQRIRALY
ncbi:MAG: relaxase/mobilization nuclease domain-containing protein, partial [Proteobacteria bacterium]|nr:relaxase/mobilization nuclease domain-containing protein [Pseudomonadota bacterium]